VSNAKNYQTQGGDKWVVEGELEITPKGKLLLHHREVTPMTAQENSQATTIAALPVPGLKRYLGPMKKLSLNRRKGDLDRRSVHPG
jgi:tmRNA-binding protein